MIGIAKTNGTYKYILIKAKENNLSADLQLSYDAIFVLENDGKISSEEATLLRNYIKIQ